MGALLRRWRWTLLVTALVIAGLAAVPVVLLAACGNAEHKIANDNGPDPRASTAGVHATRRLIAAR